MYSATRLTLCAICSCCLATLILAPSHAAASESPILLWPDTPGLNSPDGLGRQVEKRGKLNLMDVTTPHMIPYLVADAASPAPAVILCPGGSYKRLVISVHHPIAEFLNQHGIHAFLLNYRCPSDKNGEAEPDIQRAMRMVRARVKEWNIDPNQIGILGTSAGGNLGVRGSIRFGIETYPANDPIDQISAKPDFTILLYPAFLANKDGVVNDWMKIPDDISPTIIFTAKDDKNFYADSLAYEKLLKDSGKTVVAHYFEAGGHGFSLPGPEAVAAWPSLLLAWLEQNKVIAPDDSSKP